MRPTLATLILGCLGIVIAGRGKVVDGLTELKGFDLRSTLATWADAAEQLTNCSDSAAGLWDDLEDARRPLKHDTSLLYMRLLVVVVVMVVLSLVRWTTCVVPLLLAAFTLALVAAFVVADFCSFQAKDMLEAQSSHNAYLVWTLNDCQGPHPFKDAIGNISLTCPFDSSLAILQSALVCDTSSQRLYDNAVCTDMRDGFALIALALFATSLFTLLFALVRGPLVRDGSEEEDEEPSVADGSEEEEEEKDPMEEQQQQKELPPTPSLQRLMELAKRPLPPAKKTRRASQQAKVVPTNNLRPMVEELTPVESFRS